MNQSDKNAGKKRSGLANSILRTSGAIIVLGAVLLLGVGIGNGNIAFGPDAALRKSVQSSDGSLDFNEVDKLYGELRQSFDGQLDAQKLQDGMKHGLVRAAGDPYTEYLTQEESKEFNEQLSGSFEGIGAELNKKEENIVVVAPIAGFPAEKAGIKSGDIIAKVNDENVLDASLTETVKKIRGEKGTTVKLEIIRDGKLLKFEIVREQISTPSVKWEITPENIGVMTISRYGEDTAGLARQAADEFKSNNVKGVVLDVRSNPGGLLDASVKVSSLWLPNGKTVLQEKRNDVVTRTFTATGKPVLEGVPTVVLIDEGSASASEITAGALRDNNAATLIGQKSFGKGSVQELRDMNSGGLLKVTIARWFTPAGVNIDHEGIKPDQEVKLTEEDVKSGKDTQKDAAINKLR